MSNEQSNAEPARRDEGVAYTIATGRLFCDVKDFHARAEQLLGRPIWTHEFAQQAIWDEIRVAWEEQAVAALTPSETDQP